MIKTSTLAFLRSFITGSTTRSALVRLAFHLTDLACMVARGRLSYGGRHWQLNGRRDRDASSLDCACVLRKGRIQVCFHRRGTLTKTGLSTILAPRLGVDTLPTERLATTATCPFSGATQLCSRGLQLVHVEKKTASMT